ncbi:MAG TPA: MDR family MFS transporter [Myxococcales bacterium]|nr:MDR family MFS transporter [Myxococcales bacterium]
MAALEMTVVSTAMPSVVADLGGLRHYAWVFTAYMLSATITVPIYGKLADLYGRKPILQVGLVLFLVGSVASGTAHSLEQLILFRAIQGLGAGAMQPLALTIAGDIFTLEQRAKVQGWFGSVWAFSALVGPLLGGFIVKVTSWRWVFLLNVAPGVATMLLLQWALREKVKRRSSALDVAGAAVLAGAVLSVLLAAQGGATAGVAAVAAVVLTLVLVAVERKAADPVLPLSLFGNRSIAISSLAGALFSAAMFGAVTYLPLYAQGVLGATPTRAGQMMTPMLLFWPVCSTVAGFILPRIGFRPLVVGGLGMAAVANLVLALTLGPHSGLWLPMVSMGLFGAGLGFASTALLLAVQTAVGWEMRGVATASNLFFRTIGGTIGVGVLGGVLAAGIQADRTIPPNAGNELLGPTHGAGLPAEVLQHLSAALERALGLGFWIMLGCGVAAFVAGLLFPRVEPAPAVSPPPASDMMENMS